jgi:hypothetical protein
MFFLLNSKTHLYVTFEMTSYIIALFTILQNLFCVDCKQKHVNISTQKFVFSMG